MDIDVITRRVNELWKHKPMLEEVQDKWDEHRRVVDDRKAAEAQHDVNDVADERAATIRGHAEKIKGIVSAGHNG